MSPPSSDRTFNHDLLVRKADRERAKKLYPTVYELLDWPELRAAFCVVEKKAKAMKGCARVCGNWALRLGFFAMVLATAQTVFDFGLGRHAYIVPVAAVAFAVIGVFLLFGMMFGSRKRDWLESRAAAERFRQIHFQFLVAKIPEIAAGDPDFAALKAERDLLLTAQQTPLDPKQTEIVSKIIEDDECLDCWVLPPADRQTSSRVVDRNDRLDHLFEALRDLRLEHQAGYARKMYGKGHGLWPDTPAGKAAAISNLTRISTITGFVLQIIGAVLAVLADAQGSLIVPVLQFSGLFFIIIALALRVMEEGLHPQADVTRYRLYEAETSKITNRFKQAENIEDKVALLNQMEELAYLELREFLILHEESNFIL